MRKVHHHTAAPTDNTEDKLLLSRIALGDKDAFRVLYARYWSTVYSIAIGWLKSPEWSQDVVQDVFFKLWDKREKLPEVEHVRSYLFIVARNEIISAFKSKSLRLGSIEHYMEILPGNYLQPDHALGLKQSEAFVHAAVEQLSPRQKLIFQLTRQEGLSHEEIANRLGLTKETVSNHATRALHSIRIFLQHHSAIPGLLSGLILTILKKL
jgi:RNA polymerase sigma-70 factor (family 1)